MFLHSVLLLICLSSVATFSCLTQFIETYLSNMTTYLVYNTNSNVLTTYREIFSLPYPKILLNVDNQLYLFPEKELNVSYVLLLDNAEQLKNVVTNFTKRTEYNNHMNHLIIMNDTRDIDIKKVFRLLWKYDVYNVVLTLPHSGYTWYPYKKNNKCGTRVKVKSFDMCSITANPFSNKLPKSGSACVLKGILVTFPVFVQNFNDRFGRPGLVEMLIATLEKTMNVSILVGNESRQVVYTEHLDNVMLTNLTNTIVEEGIDIVATLFWPTVHHQIGKQESKIVPPIKSVK